jgi:hypothetical protein
LKEIFNKNKNEQILSKEFFPIEGGRFIKIIKKARPALD